jgi:hypothetical protein
MNRRRVTLCTLALMLATACGSSDTVTAPVVTSVAGTWTLTSVDGKPLPWVYQASDPTLEIPKLELIAKQYVITSSGTFTTSYTLRGTELDGVVNTTTTSDAGTYTLAADTVRFIFPSDGSEVVGQATASTITISRLYTEVFSKQ